ncbi:hypothetical protein [Bacillus sp. Marseille-P3800]|uniref:hypothetical protein n=1 Tax=Bacillus sp. Marseille-P3800 TaxID=2014782 RepID=UPI000C0810BC|nr:hypothetical protein [Bacillus sp. Marseille-P3800]
MKKILVSSIFASTVLLGISSTSAQAEEVNISSQHQQVIDNYINDNLSEEEMEKLDNTLDFGLSADDQEIGPQFVTHAARGTAKAIGVRSGSKYIVSALAETHRLKFGWTVTATSELSKYNNGNHTYKVKGSTGSALAGKKASSSVNRNMSLSSKGESYWAKGIHTAAYGGQIDSGVTGDITYLR